MRRSVGESAYGKLFEREVQPVLMDQRREEQFAQIAQLRRERRPQAARKAGAMA
ncbi:MAG: hypothetical protein V1902_00920 [Candidatus Falkowbacteria bacterium]